MLGFSVQGKKNLRKIDIEKANEYNVPTIFFEKLHRGEDYLNAANELIRNETLTVAGDPPKSYAYCADTAFYEPIAEKIKGVDLVYHESTYLDEHSKKAGERFHSTSKQAALIAKKAGVKKLLLGHFSSQYETLDQFKEEACEVFENTEISEEGACYMV